MDLWKHFIISAIISITLYPFFGLPSAMLLMLGGFFIDIDHIFLYWIYHRRFEFDLAKIKKFCKNVNHKDYPKVIRPLHNIEFLIICFIINVFLGVGLLIHLLMDIFEEKQRFGKVCNYSLILNMKNRG